MSTPVPEQDKWASRAFHAIPENEVFAQLGSTANGLTSQQAQANLAIFGHNDISTKKKRSIFLQYLDHFKNLLVLILLAAAAISVAVGEFTNAAIIFIIVLRSVTLDFFQEYKAGNAAELPHTKIISKVSVFRDNQQVELPLTDIVPGDLVFLTAGNIVPADARVLTSRDLSVNQSALTGEPLALKLREPTFTMSVTAGMDLNRAIFEVQASDGIHTSTITVSTFGE